MIFLKNFKTNMSEGIIFEELIYDLEFVYFVRQFLIHF